MRKIIQQKISGKKVLFLFILTNIFYAFMLLVTIPEVMSYSEGMKLMDMLPAGYDIDYVSNLLNTLGEEGRRAYLYHQIPVDMVYPLLFGIAYSSLLAYFLGKVKKHGTKLLYLCVLPLIAGAFDYLENLGIIVMLTTYPELSGGWVKATNVFTLIKSGSTTVYFTVLIITLAAWAVTLFMRRKKS